MQEVRIALLSVDHEDMEGYTDGLRAMFEEHVNEVNSFRWGGVNRAIPAQDEYDYNVQRGQERLVMYVPQAASVSVSLFMELVNNTANSRDYQDRDQKKTFTVALYEVLGDNQLGRIKLIDQVQFTRSAIGMGRIAAPGEEKEHHRIHSLHENASYGEAPSSRPIVFVERGELVEIFGRDLIPNDKARAAILQLMKGPKPKAVKTRAEKK